MAKFKVGEIATFIYEGSIDDNPDVAKFHNEDVEIMSNPFGSRWGNAYEVRWPDGIINGCDEGSLRKKKPPQETSTWEEFEEITKSGWNPTKTKVTQ